MSEHGPGPADLSGVGEAVVETRGRLSIIWLIPLIAVLAGGFVAYRALSERGPAITITFKSAEGLEAGKTQIKYKDVEVGLVESVELADDLSDVIVHARMVKGADAYLTEKTEFWVVKPRIAGGQVSGLGTLLSGAYITLDPVREGKQRRSFRGLDLAPIVTMSEPGRMFVLHSDRAGAIEVGSPVFFRKIQVGQVVSSHLDDDDDNVTTPHLHPRALREARPRRQPLLERQRHRRVARRRRRPDRHRVGDLDPDRRESPSTRRRARRPSPLQRTPCSRSMRAATTPRSVTTPRRSPGCSASISRCADSRSGRRSSFAASRSARSPTCESTSTATTKEFHIPVLIEIEPERVLSGNVTEAERREAVDKLVAPVCARS